MSSGRGRRGGRAPWHARLDRARAHRHRSAQIRGRSRCEQLGGDRHGTQHQRSASSGSPSSRWARACPSSSRSVVAAFKGNTDIAVGNVVGSNITNVLLVMGVPALFSPIGYATSYNLDFRAARAVLRRARWVRVRGYQAHHDPPRGRVLRVPVRRLHRGLGRAVASTPFETGACGRRKARGCMPSPHVTSAPHDIGPPRPPTLHPTDTCRPAASFARCQSASVARPSSRSPAPSRSLVGVATSRWSAPRQTAKQHRGQPAHGAAANRHAASCRLLMRKQPFETLRYVSDGCLRTEMGLVMCFTNGLK